MTRIQQARYLIKQGYGYKEVPEMTGITLAQFYQLKKEIPSQDFGCVVCGCSRYSSRLFCRSHRYRYVEAPKRIAKIKAA